LFPAQEFLLNELMGLADRSQAQQSCQRRFSTDFKRDAVRLVSEEKYTFAAVAPTVRVSTKSLRDWREVRRPKIDGGR
jgi:transposase-like protein